MIVAFLGRAFIEPNERVLPESELALSLEDFLQHLHEVESPDAFPKGARAT
ncbi:MAG: DUF3375 family protein [Wenzhouxiangellaceae bacterium]|nr:DUF3375 family protein [Wenzhouxiangellaceae bacterium]